MPPKYKKYDLVFKIAALDYLKYHSLENTARTFKVDGKRLREWRSKEKSIRETNEENVGARHRLPGAGRKVKDKELEIKLKNWILAKREARLRVTRKMIQKKATEENSDPNFAASNGWLEKFLTRNGFTLRKRTTISQSIPNDSAEKIINFICYLRQLQKVHNFDHSSIIAMDETPVLIEPVGSTTVDRRGVKCVPVKSTGHEKVRITVILTACGNGKRLKPFVVIPRKRVIKELNGQKDVVLAYAAKSWMDDDLTNDYLSRVLGKFSFSKRLLVWDSFLCHKSSKTKTALQKMNIFSAVIPGGCTSLIQPADVCWNRTFKSKIQSFYDEWMSRPDSDHAYTNSGKMKAPEFSVVIKWVAEAWKSVSEDCIVRSMKQCGITCAVDGSEDAGISFFKDLPDAQLQLHRKLNSPAFTVDLDDSHDPASDHFSSDEESEISWCDSDESN